MILGAAVATPCAAETPAAGFYGIVSNPFVQLDHEFTDNLRLSVELVPEFGGDPGRDSFQIEIAGNNVRVTGNTRAAMLFGTDRVAEMLSQQSGKLADGSFVDQAGLRVRAQHLVMRNATLPDMKALIDKARRARMNTLMLYIADDVQLLAAGIRPLPNAMPRDDFRAVVEYAKASGMNVVPHLPLLTKQHRFFKDTAPELMYNQATYDPRNKETVRRVFAHLEEIIDLVQPTDINIGHDEVEGAFPRIARAKWTAAQRKKWPAADEDMLPPELFLDSVRELHAFLAERGIRTWMWGDMLIAYEEFPDMVRRNMHGNHGYAALRTKLPKDIVICDWHYWDSAAFPTAKAFADAGHLVLGATRERTDNIAGFSRYVAGMGERGSESKGLGMIATLWNLQNQADPALVDDVIARSGRAFWSPDSATR